MKNCEMIKQMLTNTTDLDTKHKELQDEIKVVTELIRQCVDENAHTGFNQTEYQKRYGLLVAQYEIAKIRFEQVKEQQRVRRLKREQLNAFLDTLVKQDSTIAEFDLMNLYGL